MVKGVATSIITVAVLMGSVVACSGSDGELAELREELEDVKEQLKESKGAQDQTPTPVPSQTYPAPTSKPEPTDTVSQQQAVESAQSYLRYSSFSRSGLIDQLEYEGFSTADATYGVDAQNADWNAQAAGSAQDYLNYSSFSRSGLIDQLIYEGFTLQQATYGVNAVGL